MAEPLFTRRAATFVLLTFASGFGASMGYEARAEASLRLDAGDSEGELVRKLDLSLEGLPVDGLAARLVSLGARQVGVDIDPGSRWPVSAIFGLRRGWLSNDRRIRIFMELTSDGTLGKVADTVFYTE